MDAEHEHRWLPRQQGASRYCPDCDTFETLSPAVTETATFHYGDSYCVNCGQALPRGTYVHRCPAVTETADLRAALGILANLRDDEVDGFARRIIAAHARTFDGRYAALATDTEEAAR